MSRRDGNIKLFAVPSEKLVLMSFSTFSLYCFYWLFRNWQCISAIKNHSFSPIVRAWLFPFFNSSLFEEIKLLAEGNGIRVSWTSGLLSISFLLFLIGWYIPYALYISIFLGIILLPANKTCAQFNESNAIEEIYEGFSKTDWKIIIFGGIIVIYSFVNAVSRVLNSPIQ